MTDALEGGCECGEVRYRLSSSPIMVNCCHCRDCQRITGSAFALNAMIERERAIVTRGEPVAVDLHREGSGRTRAWRCRTCWTLLWADHPKVGDGALFVRVGTLDQGELLSPDVYFFIRSRYSWVALPAGVPAYETLPEDGVGAPLGPEREARMAAVARSGN